MKRTPARKVEPLPVGADRLITLMTVINRVQVVSAFEGRPAGL